MAGQAVVVSVLADTKQFSQAMQGLGDTTGLSKLAGGFKKLGKAVGIGALAVGAGVVAWGAESVKALAEVERIGALTESVIKSTGGAAGRSRQDIDALAGSIEKMSGIEAESVTEGQNLLLTFTNIKGTSFDRATATMSDMAVALNKGSLEGLDMTATATQLGKALNDPVKGVSALSKVGVTFTEDQKAMIQGMVDAGDVAGAQGVIMDELAKEFGGAAEAAGGTALGKWAKAKNAFGDVGETIFANLLPAVTGVTTWVLDKGIPLFSAFATTVADKVQPILASLADWFRSEGLPRLKEFGGWIKDNVLPVIVELGGWIKDTLVPNLITFGEWVVKNKDWLGALAVVVGTIVLGIMAYVRVMAIWQAALVVATAAQALFNTVMSANPIGIIILAIAALVAGLVYFFTQTETGKVIIETVWAAIKTAISAVTSWWTDTVAPALSATWDAITGFFTTGKDNVVGAVTGMWETVRGWFDWGKESIANIMDAIWTVIKTIWNYSPYGLIINNWSKITGFFGGVKDTIAGYFSNAIDWLKSAGSNIIYGLTGGISTAFSTISNWLTSIYNTVTGWFSNAGDWLKNAGSKVIGGFIDGIKGAIGGVKDTLGGLTSKLTSWKGPESLDKVILKDAGALVIQGFINGLKSKFGGVRKTLTGLTSTIGKTDMGTIEAKARLSVQPEVFDASGAGRNPTGPTYNITVQALVPGPDTGRTIVKAIRDYERAGGSR